MKLKIEAGETYDGVDWPGLRVLDAGGTGAFALTVLPQCASLYEANLSGSGIEAGLEAFGSALDLHVLNLSSNLIQDVAPLPELALLRKLDLSHNLLEVIGPLPFPRLEVLNLSCNKLTALGFGSLKFLKELDASSNALTELQLPPLPWLRRLILADNQIAAIGALELPAVWFIDLRNNKVADKSTVDALSGLPLLTDLALAGNGVEDARPDVIVKLRNLTVLDGRVVGAKDRVKARLIVAG